MKMEMLTALLRVNQYIAELRPTIAPEARVFVGAQYSPATNADAWTKCVPESGVLIIQLSVRSSEMTPEMLRIVAAHELCHARLHGKFMCAGADTPGAFVPPVLRMRMEQEAVLCSAEMLSP